MRVPLKKLSEVAIINPRRPSIERNDSTLTSFVPMENVDDVRGEVLRVNREPYSKLKKGYTYFEEGDVIFAKITPCMQNGKHAIVSGLADGFGFGSTEFHVIRATELVIPEWIHFYLRRKETLDAAIKTFTGAVGQQRVPSSFLQFLVIPIPPLDIQRQIAARLKDQLAEVETARQAAQSQWYELQSLKSKTFETVFESITDRVPIRTIAKVQSGYAFKSETFTSLGVRLLRNANILPGRVYWDDTVYLHEEDAKRFPTYKLAAGDVLISLDRPIISSGIKVARVRQTDLPALLLQRVGRFLFDSNELDADYLYAFLQSDHFIKGISGHDQSLGVPHISPDQVESVEIPLPDISTQRQLAKRLTQITESWLVASHALKQQIFDLAVLPQRLLAQAFTRLT